MFSVPSLELLQCIYSNVVVCKMQCTGSRSKTDKIKILPSQKGQFDVENLEVIPKWAQNPLGLAAQAKGGDLALLLAG